MAVSRVSQATVLVTSDALSSYTSSSDFTVAGGASNFLVVVAEFLMGTTVVADDAVTVTAGGVSMLRGASIASTIAAYPYVGIFYLPNPSSGAKTIVATSTAAMRSCTLTCIEGAGGDLANLLGATTTARSNNSTYARSLTAQAAGGAIYSGLAIRGGPKTFTPDTGVTELLDTSTGTVLANDHSAFVGEVLPTSVTAMDVGATPSASDPVAFAAVEFKAANDNIGAGTGSSSGAATVSGAGSATTAASGSAAGGSSAQATSQAGQVNAGAGTSAGASAVSGQGLAIASAAGAASGSSSAQGYAPANASPAAGTAAGNATVSGQGTAVRAGAGVASGAATVAANTATLIAAIGAAPGGSTAAASAAIIAVATGTAQGFSFVQGRAPFIATVPTAERTDLVPETERMDFAPYLNRMDFAEAINRMDYTPYIARRDAA